MVRLDAVLKKLMGEDGKQVQSDYQSLERIVRVLENNLVMVSCALTFSSFATIVVLSLTESNFRLSMFGIVANRVEQLRPQGLERRLETPLLEGSKRAWTGCFTVVANSIGRFES